MADFWVMLSTFPTQLSSKLQPLHTQQKLPEQPELDVAASPHPLFSLFILPRVRFSSNLRELKDFSTHSCHLPAV